MKESSLTGINIQWPISELIISGEKTIETRTYPLPEKYINKEMAFIETPGKSGGFKARVIGIIKFTNCFKYKDKKEFYKDYESHKVDINSPWAWKDEKPKYGWEFIILKKFKEPLPCNSKGIIYRKNIKVVI